MSIVDIKRIDDNYYKAKYINQSYYQTKELENILAEIDISLATTVITDKALVASEKSLFENKKAPKIKTLAGPTICEFLLRNPDIDPVSYGKLVHNIIFYEDIGRLTFGQNGDAPTFLMKILMNDELCLTDYEKEKIIAEANKISKTKKYVDRKNNLERRHSSKVTKEEYDFSEADSHTNCTCDLRYLILMNHNFTLNEKQALVQSFYANDDDFKDAYGAWICELERELRNETDGPITDLSVENLLTLCKNDNRLAYKYYHQLEHLRAIYNMRLTLTKK